MTILNSASKIVLIGLTAAVIAGMFLHIIDPKDFMIVVGMVFTYYFTNKGDTAAQIPPGQ